MRNRILQTLLFFCLPLLAIGQLSEGGIPYGLDETKLPKSKARLAAIETIDLPKLNLDSLRKKAEENDRNGGPYIFGKKVMVGIDIKSKEPIITNDGGKLWIWRFKADSAQSLNAYFSTYKLAKGAKLFIYTNEGKKIIGAFTEQNNQAHGRLATELIYSDEIILEFYEPSNVKDSNVTLESFGIGFKSIHSALGFGDSGSCHININCNEGNTWQNEKKSVIKMIIPSSNGQTGLCTGSLINSTEQDGRPIILTANHCIASGAIFSDIIFNFNYESLNCITPNTQPTFQSWTGSILKASNVNSDFALLELTQLPPTTFNLFYAGWDKSGAIPTNTTTIHHPKGDIKKISGDYDSPLKTIHNSANCWQVEWNFGRTEGGSSGSPLFDANKRIIGQLYGGPSSCTTLFLPDYYGQFDISWNTGQSSNTRLKDWLDPTNTGVTVLNGTACPIYYSKEAANISNSPLNWYRTYAINATKWGLVQSINKNFNASKVITVGDAARTIVLAAHKLGLSGYSTVVDEPCHATNPNVPFVNILQRKGFLTSSQASNPNANITFGLLCKLINEIVLGTDFAKTNRDATRTKVLVAQDANEKNSILALSFVKGVKFATESLSQKIAEYVISGYKNKTITGNEQVTNDVLAKVISNAYIFRYSKLNGGIYPQSIGNPENSIANGRTSATQGSDNPDDWTEVGDKYENTSTPYGSEIPQRTLSSITMVSGQQRTFSFPDVTIGGLPVHVYWAVDGGTLVPVSNTFQSVNFTAPTVTATKTLQLYYYAATDGGYAAEFFQDIVVNPSGTPPSNTGINIQVSSTAIDFGNVSLGSTADRTLTITNPTTSTGSLVGAFEMLSGTAFNLLSGPNTFNISPGQSVSYSFRFQPTAGGTFTLPFKINHNASNYSSQLSINLSGASPTVSSPEILNCTSAANLSCGVVFTGTTTGATNNVTIYDNYYTYASGPEKVHKFISPTSGRLRVKFSESIAGNLLLFITNSCSKSSVIKMVSGSPETDVYLDVVANQTYYFIVDGQDGANGAYSLLLICPNVPLPPGIGGCLSGNVTSLNWGYIQVNNLYIHPTSITITNTSATQAISGNITFSGPDAAKFDVLQGQIYQSLGPGESFTVDIILNGDLSKDYLAYMKFTDNNLSCTNTISIPLTATTIPYFTITKPIGGETFYMGYQPENIITWNTNLPQYSVIEVQTSYDGGVTWSNSTSVDNTNSNTLSIGIICTEKGKIRMRSASTEPWVISSGFFKVKERPDANSFYMIFPNGNNTFAGGQVITATWSNPNGLSLTLQYSLDGGITWINITNGATTGSSANWTVPYISNTNNNVRIRIYEFSRDDMSDCPFTIIATTPPAITYTSTITQPTCSTSNNGSIALTVTGGTIPYTFQWKKDGNVVGTNSSTLSNIAVGTYELKITDANGTVKTGYLAVSATNFNVTYTTTTATCSKNNGSALLSISPTGTYSYNWEGGSTSNSISSKIGGTYNVRITHNNSGCFQDISVTIPSSISNVTVNIPQPTTICFGSTTSASANASGGISPFSYRWSNGGTSQSVTSLSAGSYQCVVSDANGCQGSGQVLVNQGDEIIAPTVSSITINSVQTATLTVNGCAGTVTWYANATGGTGLTTGTSYTTPTLTTTTTYYASCTISNCESSRGSGIVTVNCVTPSAPTISSTTINSGQTTTLTASGCAGTVTWYANATGGTGLTTGTSFTTPVLTTTTTYYASCMVTGCESSRGSGTVTVNCTPPTAPTVSSVTINSGQTATLTASSCAGTITWYANATGGAGLTTGTSYTTPTLTNTTTYYASCTVGGCESSRGSGVVTVNSATQTITISNPSSGAFSAGQSISVIYTSANGTANISLELVSCTGTTSLGMIGDGVASSGTRNYMLPSNLATGQYRIKSYVTGTTGQGQYGTCFTVNSSNPCPPSISHSGSVVANIYSASQSITSTSNVSSATKYIAGQYIFLNPGFQAGPNETFTAQIGGCLPTSGLIAYYPFNGNVNDESGNLNHATNNAATLTTDRNGIANTAFDFNGTSSWINTPLVQSNLSGYTISVWVKPDFTTNKEFVVWQNRGVTPGSGRSFTLHYQYSTNRWGFAIDGDALYTGKQAPYTNSTNWVHVVGTWSSGGATVFSPTQFNVYINGVLVSASSYQGNSASIPNTGSGTCTIGSHEAWNSYFKGKIDDIRIYNRALSATEIQNIYNFEK